MAERIVDWNQLYPGVYLGGGYLREHEQKTLTISGVDVQELETDKGPKGKGILSFQEEKLKWPLNKTNGICLREMFGRVPYKWVGKRVTIFGTFHGQDPAIRVWGSPDITEDIVVEIKLPKKHPFKMTMHAMGAERAPRNAGKQRARKSQPPAEQEPLRDRAQELLDMMARAGNQDELTEVDEIIRTEDDDFNAREIRVLTKALERRRGQLKEEGPTDDDTISAGHDDNIPF